MPGVDMERTKGVGLVAVMSPDDVTAEENAKKEAENAPPEKDQILTGLGAYVLRCWEAARNAKSSTITPRLNECLRRKKGEYSPEKMALIQAHGGSDVYMMLTNVKCRASESWLRDILLPSGDRPWDLEPTPVADLPPVYDQIIQERVAQESAAFIQAIGQPVSPAGTYYRTEQLRDLVRVRRQDEAKKIAGRMAVVIEDQLVEGGFKKAFNEILQDITTYPVAILKGPVARKKRRLAWQENNGGFQCVVENEIISEFMRVSPFDIYPAPGITNVDDGYIIEKHNLVSADLEAMLGVEGFNDDEIREVLKRYSSGGLKDWLWAGDDEDERDQRDILWDSPEVFIEALEFWGTAHGQDLSDWGMSADQIPDLDRHYSITAWSVGGHIIKAVMNPDPLGRKPYYVSSFSAVPGSFWGIALPELIADIQDICNATARSLVNNMGIASGPQAEINVDRIPPGQDVTNIYPWKIWQSTSDMVGSAGGSPAVRFFQPDTNAAILMKVYEYFSKLADDYSGVPAYAYGGTFQLGGAGRTAAGLSMLMSAASKGIKQVIANMDEILEALIERKYQHNMLYHPDNSIKGDLRVVARGSSVLLAKEQQQVRRAEFLTATANPIDLQIMGMRGRAAILRANAEGLDLNVDKIVPPDEVIQFMSMPQGPGGGPPGAVPGGAPRELDVSGRPMGESVAQPGIQTGA